MKKNLILLMLCAFGLSTFAQNPLVSVDHSLFANEASLIDVYGFGIPSAYPEDHNTFRVYGYLDDANSVMQSVVGLSGGLESYIGTDTPDGNLWNYPAGVAITTAWQISDQFIPFFGDNGTIMYDSYVTIGSENDSWSGGVNNGPGSQGSVTFGSGESNVSVAAYWGNEIHSDIDNPDFIMTNEAWLLLDVSSINAFGIGPDFRVLLAQLTTSADDIHYGLNITALTDVPLSGGETWITYHDASGLGGTSFMEADGSNMGLLYPLNSAGCTDPNACNFDSSAIDDDGTCSFINDEPDCSEIIDPVSSLEECVNIPVDLNGAANSEISVDPGAEIWYSFVAVSSVVHATLTNVQTDGGGALFGLYNSEFEFIEEGNFTEGSEDEALIVEDLIVGETYYIAVEEMNTNPSTMMGNLCIIQYPGSKCDLPPSLASGPFTIQSQMKADYVPSAVGYRLTLKSTTTGLKYSSPGQAGTWIYIVHTGIPNTDDNYDVCLEACYTVQTPTGPIIVYVTRSTCNIDVERFDTYLVGAHNCTNITWPLSGRPKAAPPQVDAGSFTWHFTEIGTTNSWEYTTPSAARKLPAGGLGAIVEDGGGANVILEGTTYDVRIRANYNSGNLSDFGPSDCLTVAGASGGQAANGPNDTNDTFADAAKSVEDLYGETLTIYPNPSNGEYLNLSISEVDANKVLVDVFDLQGRIIQSLQLSADIDAPFSQKISLDNLSSGLYVVKVTAGNSVTTTELSVVK